MNICMAASYDIKNPRSWSGTPYSLYKTLSSYKDNEISDINLNDYHTNTNVGINMIKNISLSQSIKQRKYVSKAGLSTTNSLNSKILDSYCKKKNFDALIQFGGFLPQKNYPPYYVYTDASHDLKLDYLSKYGTLPYVALGENLDDIKRSSEFVRKIYQEATGVLCMSQWLADSMINTTGVAPEKVHVVYAGANWHDVTLPQNIVPKTIQGKKNFNILLTGVDYLGKGADIACKAVDELNKNFENKYTLHICGVQEKFEHSKNVVNHGFINKFELIEMLKSSDLFVLPSRFDCFGIAFVEAMTFGLPCIGRNICAMPEIIDQGKNGELVSDDDPIKLAELIEKICSNESLYEEYSVNAIKKAEKFTWKNVGNDIMEIISAN